MRWRNLSAPVAASVLISMAMLAVIFTANDSALIRESPSRSFSSKDEQAIAAATAGPVDCRLVDHRGYWQMGHGAECCRHHFHTAAKQCKATQQSCDHLRDEQSDPQACNGLVHDHCNEQKMEESGFFHEDNLPDAPTSPIDYLLAHPSEMMKQHTEKKKTNRKKKHIQQKEKKSADLAEAEEKKVVGQQMENKEKKATGSEMELLQSLPLGRRLKHDKKMSAKKELAKKQKLKHVVTKPKATKDRMAVSTSPFIRCYAAGIRHCKAQLKPSKVKALQGCMQLSSARTNQCFSAARTARDACITKSRLDYDSY